MTISDNEIAARLNLEHIAQGAQWAAARLSRSDVAIVDLTPGDGTIYNIIVCNPQERFSTETDEPTRNYWVTLANFNKAYQWAGGWLNSSYVAEKWTDGNRWTAVVMTDFLRCLSDAILNERHQP